MLASNTDTLVVIAILAVRLIVPLFIPRFPLPAILVCLVVDAADQTILQRSTDFSLDRYQSFDKALDIYYLAIAYLTVFRNWTNDFTDFMKETVFGVDPTSSWSDAFSNRPGVLLAIVLVIVGIAVVAWRLRKRLPTADWSFGVDMNRTDVTVRRAEPVPTSMMAGVLEKVALIGLVGAIFANVLEVDSTAWQIVGATVLVVLANAGISIWLSRRGIHWSSLALEFVVLGAVNTLLLSAYASLIGDGEVDRSLALFFGLLLTVLIVLYDLYRPAVREDATVEV